MMAALYLKKGAVINLQVKDKFELQAIHKALMEAKFHPSPEQPIVQSSPMVANFMHKVVNELEKINWVTEAEKKFRGIEYKNDWAEWRRNPPESIVLPCVVCNLSEIEELENTSEQEFFEFMEVLLSPYKVTKDKISEIVTAAKTKKI
ncbi:hypothetical protein [Allohahella sp. A8]|uniref:hypothetical protein n=1 Tax=Allohahella sp. A8 TaxID=3141461 RepID=UPI003A8111C0